MIEAENFVTVMAQQTSVGVGTSIDRLQTESLRLTAFPAPSSQIHEPNWWLELTGKQPDTRVSRPGAGELQEEGTLNGRTLTLLLQPGRVDWFLSRHFEADAANEATRWAGSFSDGLQIFQRPMDRWLHICPPVIRLAFGAILYDPVTDRQAGYRKLAEYLPEIRIDPERSQDFLYQINRPRESTVLKGLMINRLSKWSSAVSIPVRIAIMPGSISSVYPRAESTHACRIELDISSAADFHQELPQPKLQAIFEELKNLAVEIATRGDIP